MNRRFFCLRGFMKSGTNWLGSLLSSHHHISVVGEFHWQVIRGQLQQQLDQLTIYNDQTSSHDPHLKDFVLRKFEEWVRESLATAADPNATVIGDRTPHTISPIILGDAPVISIVRDGRDVLVSRAFHLHNYPSVHGLFDRVPEMRADHEAFKADPWHFQKHPEALLAHEVMVRESVRGWREHLESDRKTLSQNRVAHRLVRYEDLHADTEAKRRELFEFLQVNPNAASELTNFLKPGFKESPNEFYRKGAVGDWKTYFTAATKSWFKEEAGEALIAEGYESSLRW